MADYVYVTATGTVIPDTADTRNEVVSEFRGIFGDDFIVEPETPEGLWIDAETTSRQSVARNNAAVANQINPNLSGGPFLDAIWALTGGQRTVATRSTVSATLTGVANTTILAGSVARTAEGVQFEAVDDVTIPVSGTLVGAAFQSVEPGPVEAGANQLTMIVDAVLGWETITNPAAATLGRATETDEVARSRRRRTIGLQGRAVAEAVRANVLNVPGVRSLSFRENITNMTQTIDGVQLVAHSIWTAIDGGADDDIGAALLKSKTAGANWNGAQTVMVTEPASRQQYTVRFDRPTALSVAVRCMVRRVSSVSDPITAVRTSVLRYARGEIGGEEGFTVDADVSPFEIASAVNSDNPTIFITRCEVAAAGPSPVWSTNVFPIALNQIATLIASNIVVVIV